MDFKQFEDLICQAELVQKSSDIKSINQFKQIESLQETAQLQQFNFKPKTKHTKQNQTDAIVGTANFSSNTYPIQDFLVIIPDTKSQYTQVQIESTENSTAMISEVCQKFIQTIEIQLDQKDYSLKEENIEFYNQKLKLKQAKKFNDQILTKLEETELDNQNLAKQLQNLNKKWEKLVDQLTNDNNQKTIDIQELKLEIQSKTEIHINAKAQTLQYEQIISDLNSQLEELKSIITFQQAKIDDLSQDKLYLQTLSQHKEPLILLEKEVSTDQTYHLENQQQVEVQVYEFSLQVDYIVTSEDKQIDNICEVRNRKIQTRDEITIGNDSCIQVYISCENCQEISNKYQSQSNLNKDNKIQIDELEEEIIDLQTLVNDLQLENEKLKKKSRLSEKENQQMKDQLEQFEDLMNEVKQQIQVLHIDLDSKDGILLQKQDQILQLEHKIEVVIEERDKAIQNFEKIKVMFK
ncbi:hypothetical protein SS50377_22172 [Spironucleus salmonicida]|uniref:Uncharacterized protein n=1 Tax=Spironucleus salmonicida TaxID=348837 RepID=V6LLV9_9EUKA|nr:hypothetical protein SS50377_22172 [Spironucleus salmonicida]|eukprot:EST45667.1 Hypothetical protein SS50377_14239 [Spironucleus salmonicida]